MAKSKQGITWTNERRKLSDLIPWDRNPRTINNAQAERLVDSVETFGQVETLAIDCRNNILNGHQRASVLAGKHGMDYEVDVRVANRVLTERERQQLTVYLHKGAAGEWDTASLFENFDFNDLTAWGFDSDELEAMFADMQPEPPSAGTDTPPEIDKAEELGQKWQTAVGQIWRIGDHVVICGDCREPDTWQRLLQVANVDKVNGVFTSPPYAMQRKDQYGGVPTNEYVAWWDAVQANVKVNLAQDGSFFVNIKAHCEDGQRVLYCMDLVCCMVRRWEWRFVDELCWRKAKDGYPGGYPNRFRDAFEPVYHFSIDKAIKFTKWNVAHKSDSAFKYSRGNKSQNSTGSGFGLNGAGLETSEGLALPSNVLEIGEVNPDEALSQSAMFPVALPDFFIRAYSDVGDVWADPFLGSGTTIVAAHNNKRRGLGSEMLPKYLGVILERLQDHVGVEPKLIST
jgi:site-specific DNA-methyltransferase (adenine-specific)